MAKKVIIIDDSTAQLNIIKSYFVNDFWQVYTASSAQNGLELIYKNAPDLIISDAIMPKIGGFSLIKLIRETSGISKIPIIIYSILPENNAKYYIREELSEYFLKKDDNLDELLALANDTIKNHPLSAEYKAEILKKNSKEINTEEILESNKNMPEIKTVKKDPQVYINKLENYDNFQIDDKLLFTNMFSILYEILDYDLSALCVYSFNEKENCTYFDIKNILLSPILQDYILKKFNAKKSFLFKSYTPNLQTVKEENEFNSKLEFNFSQGEMLIGNFIFYSKEKMKWQDDKLTDKLRKTLEKFLKTRHVSNLSAKNRKNTGKKYDDESNNIINSKIDSLKTDNMYYALINIINFAQISQNLDTEDLDVLNSKISEKIITYLDKNEHIHKIHEDEYEIIIFAKDENEAYYKFNSIIIALNTLALNENAINASIGAWSLNNKNFNMYEIRRILRKTIENNSDNQKVVIENAK